MKLLLDTHVFLWLNNAPEKLSDNARQLCETSQNSLYLSVASVWEIQIKEQLGKLTLDIPWQDMIETQQRDNNLLLMPIELVHIEKLAELPAIHRDPFDRMLIAQALSEDMSIVSVDSIFGEYPAKLVS